MKKMILALSLGVTVLVLASCASKGTVDQNTAPAQPVKTSHHHDYKGEAK